MIGNDGASQSELNIQLAEVYMAAELGCESCEMANVVAMTKGRKVEPGNICEAWWYLFEYGLFRQ